MAEPWPKSAVAALSLAALHAVSLTLLGGTRAGSLLSEVLQLASVGLTTLVCLRTGRRRSGSPGRFFWLLGLGFACWFLGQLILLGQIYARGARVPAVAPSDVPFLAFYLPVFAALFPGSDDAPRIDWARTLDLAQVGLFLSSVYLYFRLALNLDEPHHVITRHFGVLDTYSLLNLLLLGSYVYAWAASRGEARALYGRMASIFALYSAGDAVNTYQVIQGTGYSGDLADLAFSVPFALTTVSAATWPARWEAGSDPAGQGPAWRLFPLLPPALVLVVAASVARANLLLAAIPIAGSFLCFGTRLLVTQHRQGQTVERLRRSEAEYRSLVENAPYGIFRYRAEDDRFSRVNQALANILGYATPQAVLALRPSTDVFAEPEGQARLLAYAARPEPSSGLEVEWKRADGTRSLVSLRTQRAPEGQPAGAPLEFSAEDVTQNRHLEEQLRQAVKMEAVGRLAGGVAHDFNNLLMVVTGAAELMRRRLEEGSPHLAHIGMIQKAAGDAADLTRQLLAFSRRQSLEPKVLDLNRVLGDMAGMLPRVIEESIEQRMLHGPALGRVKADLVQMRQVVLNLAVNARDAMPQGGTLTLQTSNAEVDEAFARLHPGLRPGSYVSLSVTDTGRGMDAETRARVFEPFFTTKGKGKGTGLGLATVYGIVKQSGGHIRVESEPGRGSTFIVLLPCFEGPPEPGAP